jgi:rhodanese-related sulfurtransferase
VDELKALLREPDVVVVDLRIDKHWKRSDSKIAGAVRKDPDKVDSWMHEIGRDKRVVTYCA